MEQFIINSLITIGAILFGAIYPIIHAPKDADIPFFILCLISFGLLSLSLWK